METLKRILDLSNSKFNKDTEFEKALNLKPKTVDSWKRGNSKGYYQILPSICSLLEVSADYLLGLDDVPNRQTKKELLDEYIDSYVAFIDILGFKKFVDEKPKEYVNNFFDDVKDVSKKSSVKFKSKFLTQEMLSKVIFSSFSDTIILSISKSEPYALNVLIFMVNTMVSNLLFSYQLLVRGAITEGNFYNANNVLFGPALNRAAELEHEISKYPRIVIQKNLLTSYTDTIVNDINAVERIERYIIKDTIINDFSYPILNYIHYCIMRLSYLNNNVAIKTINKIINEAENKLKDPEESIRIKWLYFAFYFNDELKKYTEFKDMKISIPLSMNTDFNNKDENNNQILFKLSEDKQRLLKMYGMLTEREQGEILGELKTLTRERIDKEISDHINNTKEVVNPFRKPTNTD